MHKFLIPAVLALASFAQAQTSCGTLAITGSGAASTNLDVALTGATANGFALVFVGETVGSTTINLGMSSLTIGLDMPFFPVFLGRTDGNGDAALTIPLPATIPQQLGLNAQAATLGFTLRPFGFSGCTSNTVAFTIG